MMSSKDILNILTTLGNREIYGAESLGYLPSMLLAKWLYDNRSLAPKYCDEIVFYEGVNPDNLWYVANRITGFCQPFDTENLDKERLFIPERDFPKANGENAMKYAATVLCSLDLSAENITARDIASALDEYIDSLCLNSLLRRGKKSIATKLVGKLIRNLEEPIVAIRKLEENPKTVMDPFCKFGAMFDYIGPEFSKVATAESDIYRAITFIRRALRGEVVELNPTSSIETPKTNTEGTLMTYPFVVSDIVGINNNTASTAYQLDVHKRFQPYLPNAESLNVTTAALNAIGIADKSDGHCILITDTGLGYHPIFGIFNGLVLKQTYRPFLANDWIRAVIMVPTPHTVETKFRRGRLANISTIIYVFSKCKPVELTNKILFVDAMSCKSESDILEKVTDVFSHPREISGFSALVQLGEIIEQPRPNLNPAYYTSVLEPQKCEDIEKIIRDIERLEDRHATIKNDIKKIVGLLLGKEH